MPSNKHAYLVVKLFGAVCFMFVFGFALVPLYDVFCEVTGINGKTNTSAYAKRAAPTIDRSRTVNVQFIARNNGDMNWHFMPKKKMMSVHPGESILTHFSVNNPNGHTMIAQAIPSVSPGRAASYFHKTACFCFEKQPLRSNEGIDMPLVFVVDHDLPRDIKTITLAYTLFDVTDKNLLENSENGY